MTGPAADPATESFVAHRNLLFTVAYEMLGSAADAEDVLQETWLRWAEVGLDQVRDRRAYLVRITTRQALNRLRTVKRRREAYVGPWLPEPLLTTPDVAEDVELAESVSMALMIVLERLSPTERAVFVLREVFDVLAPDVVLVSDGGGVKQAALRPIAGAGKVVRFMLGGLGKAEGAITGDPTVVNGNPALVVRLDGEMDGVLAVRVEGARIIGLYYVRNPEKLTRVESATALTLR